MTPFDPLLRLLPPALRPSIAPAISERAWQLAGILGVEPSTLPTLRLGRQLHYRPTTLSKPDGRERRLLAPSPELKRLQRWLLDNYLADLPVHPAATAFHRGGSIVANARPHARNTLVATVDLRDFFESTRAGRVRGFFARQGWEGEELRTLMRLCTFDGGLPQGAPTSPALSNLVNVGLDDRLAQLARRSGGVYTRYGDDLTFSWPADALPRGFTRTVEDQLARAGYEIQPLKGWRITPVADRPHVAGVVLRGDGRLGVPWPIRRRIWLLRWRHLWSGDPATRAQLAGYRGFVAMVGR